MDPYAMPQPRPFYGRVRPPVRWQPFKNARRWERKRPVRQRPYRTLDITNQWGVKRCHEYMCRSGMVPASPYLTAEMLGIPEGISDADSIETIALSLCQQDVASREFRKDMSYPSLRFDAMYAMGYTFDWNLHAWVKR